MDSDEAIIMCAFPTSGTAAAPAKMLLPEYLNCPVYERFTPTEMLGMYAEKSETFWAQQQETQMVRMFRNMSEHVPAYRTFLESVGIRAEKITRYEQLAEIPSIDKKNYFQAFPFRELLWEGSEATQPMIMTATSGSTGKPTYFARSHVLDWGMSLVSEFFLNHARKGSTLYVCGFSMGIWIGGLITSLGFHYAGMRGLPVTIITPGINKTEIFNALRDLGPSFDNVVIAGYPPFVKDILDELSVEGIDASKMNLRLIFAAEGFTENFRDNVVRSGALKSPYFDTLSIYGTAELGAQAHETPTSIFVRRLALKHPDAYCELFSDTKKLPTLTQYNPLLANFQEQDGQLFITGNSAMPVFRYRIGDNGGTLTLSRIKEVFAKVGVDLDHEARNEGVPLLALPFCYVYERADLSTSLYGLQIYPQTIKRALESEGFYALLTGKFSMATSYDDNKDQYFEINLELMRGQKPHPDLVSAVERAVVSRLLAENSEYRELARMLPTGRTAPHLVFWEYNHPKHFASGVKQQWSKKN